MHHTSQLCLIVQPDFTVLADATAPEYETVREQLMRFAELERAPEQLHFFRITPLSLWNAAATGMSLVQIIDLLSRHSRLMLPPEVVTGIVDYIGRYGRIELARVDEQLILRSEDAALLQQLADDERVAPLLGERIGRHAVVLDPAARGEIKQLLVELGFPPADTPATARARPWRSSCAHLPSGAAHGSCGHISRRRSSRSGSTAPSAAARVWWCCRAGRARRSSAWV